MRRKQYWVVPDGTQWRVKHEGKVLSSHYTKQAAIDAGRLVARANAPSQLLVMRADGTIEFEHTYEYDPYPPVG